MAVSQIAKKGSTVLGPYKVGDLVVANIENGSVGLQGLLSGRSLEHGTFGKVLSRGPGTDRVTCVFHGGLEIGVLLSEIQLKADYMNQVKKSRVASVLIKKEQRRQQKEVVESFQRQGQEDVEGVEVAEAFMCRVCDFLLVDPVSISCGHTLCRGCVEAWKETREQLGRSFNCPCCTQKMEYAPKEQPNMWREIQELYPRQLAEREAELKSPEEPDEPSLLTSEGQPARSCSS